MTGVLPDDRACAPGRAARSAAERRGASEPATRLGARVLPAHLESNFINPDYRGAQPQCVPAEAASAASGAPGAYGDERRRR